MQTPDTVLSDPEFYLVIQIQTIQLGCRWEERYESFSIGKKYCKNIIKKL